MKPKSKKKTPKGINKLASFIVEETVNSKPKPPLIKKS
jgi:hypothetical protein